MKKLCKDCKWYRKDYLSHLFGMGCRYDTCASPNTILDYVTGNERRYCDILRSNRWEDLDFSCGPEGRFFEWKNSSKKYQLSKVDMS